PNAWRAVDPHATAVELDELAAQRKPEPGAFALLVVVELTERLERLGETLRVDAASGIPNRHCCLAIVDPDRRPNPAVVGEANGISQKIEQYLANSRPIEIHHKRIRRKLDFQTQVFRVGQPSNDLRRL